METEINWTLGYDYNNHPHCQFQFSMFTKTAFILLTNWLYESYKYEFIRHE